MLITRTPDGRLTFLQAMASRRKAALAAGLPATFTGYLITDGYTGYQHLLLSRLAGIQQCAAHVIRRCQAVTKLGPGGVQDWARDIITILREAHQAVEAARARGDTALDQQNLDDLRERYDNAVASGIIHNRLRDWDGGGTTPATPSAPGCANIRNRFSCSPASSPSAGRIIPMLPLCRSPGWAGVFPLAGAVAWPRSSA